MSEIKSISECINNTFIELTNPKNQLCQELGKLLFYNDGNPLSHLNIDNLPNLILNNNGLEGEELLKLIRFKKILPFPFGTETLKEPTSLLMITYYSGDGRRVVLNDGYISIQILCHVGIWKLDEGIRPLEILDRIVDILNCNKNVGGINNLGLLFDSALRIKDSKNYHGYNAMFRITNLNSGRL